MAEKRLLGGLFDNCTILFFIILFLLLFWGNGSGRKTETNEVE